jgi:kumamolisin
MPEEVDVTLWLASSKADPFTETTLAALSATPVLERTYYSRAQLHRSGDSDAGVRAAVAAHFAQHGLARVEHRWRRVTVRGPAADCTEALRMLRKTRLGNEVVAAFGLEPTVRTQSYAHRSAVDPAHAVSALEVARAYHMPSGLDGAGTSVAIVHFSGSFRPSDFELALAAVHVPVPRYVLRGVNAPSSLEDDVEIALDTQMVGALAPGATLALYRGRSDAGGYADTFAQALLDEVAAPSVISISYGVEEGAWPAGAMQLLDRLFIAAALCGITVVAASGDRGAEVSEREPRVVFPASSRFTLACGGTDLLLERGHRIAEKVWNEPGGASGGGYSRVFERPRWQAGFERMPGRGVPDVAGHAAMATGYRVYLDGKPHAVGGTSAVAPLWAAFVALVNQRLGQPCGFFTPLLYGGGSSKLFYDITSGSNGRYRARAGWDPCTGLGSPHFGELLRFFTGGR